ncbi:hypothetical protein [Paenibacillus sp. UMB4589-SE434]|uniref:hypothetical protein n=1 Tax=Paenibacillus sp. UMB4589-SE434 TaxID=3046314 RepID=UPI00254F8CD3|nr:hypothetical protein [Paenibacillus sp. UMB4589-SE434]MDK8181270.1 hypothetical protein [Paenibacillus sp. UMB4589-SE434]
MEYKHVIQTTIKEVYPNYLVKKLLKTLEEEKGIISYKANLFSQDAYIFSNEDGSTYHPKYDATELLTTLEHKTTDVISVIQDQEYESPYSYSVLFEIQADWANNLKTAIDEGIIISTESDDYLYDQLSTSIINCKPSHKKVAGLDILKFSLHLVGYLPQENDNKREIVYPIICLLNTETKMLEIRFEKVKGYISNGEGGFYIKKIEEVKQRLEGLLGIELLAINLSSIVKYIKETLNESEENEVAVSAQALEYHTGSKAVLDTGNNDNMILPLIGNLKDILRNHEDLFDANDETRQIQELLEEIILEAEYLSDHPWITLAWKNEVKSKVLKVKFLFNYHGQDFSVLQYYGNNADSERMSYVTQFIFDNKQQLASQTE